MLPSRVMHDCLKRTRYAVIAQDLALRSDETHVIPVTATGLAECTGRFALGQIPGSVLATASRNSALVMSVTSSLQASARAAYRELLRASAVTFAGDVPVRNGEKQI